MPEGIREFHLNNSLCLAELDMFSQYKASRADNLIE